MATEVESTSGMETDEIKELKGKLLITFLNAQNLSTNGSLGLTTLKDVNFTTMTLGELRDRIIQDSKSPSNAADGIDILHKTQIITPQVTSTLQHLNLKPNSIVQVVKRFRRASPKDKSDKAVADAGGTASKDKSFTPEQLHQVSLALRTGFMQPSFAKTIKRLGDSEMLDSIIAIAPRLATDTVGLAIIQSPGMIYYYSDLEPMKKLADERPWVIDAFNFIAAAVHQDKSLSSSGFPRALLASSLLEADAEGDDEMDDDQAARSPRSGSNTPRPTSASAARPSRSQPNVFTREHVEQAIRAAFPFNIPQPPGGSPSGGGSGGTRTNLSDLYRSLQQTVSASQSASSSPSASALGSAPAAPAQQAGSPSAPGPISPNDFARAIMEAVNHLPESVRAEQLNLLRDRIQQISGASGSGGAPGQTQQAASVMSAEPASNSSSGTQEYRAELNQMREIGITNERLALQALRVCDGDVTTACDLILSGWNGEGAEVDRE